MNSSHVFTPAPPPARARWTLSDIDFSAIRHDQVRGDEQLFYLLVCASFVEILADLYTGNLAARYADDAQASGWLREHWQHEEVQHGHALQAYVRAAWPDFDWERAYAGFATEYGAMCTMEQLEPSRALEMAARCVVEVGTATLYRSLEQAAREPVLRGLLARIKADEVAHYKQFQRLYERYGASEKPGFWRVFRTVARRLLEARGEDSAIAYKHAYLGRHPDAGLAEQQAAWRGFQRALGPWARRHYPYRMAVSMLLAVLPLPARVRRGAQRPLVGMARLVLFG